MVILTILHIPMEIKISYVSKTRAVNEKFKLAFHMYLNEVFAYVGFLSYHSLCDSFFWGQRGKQGSKTVKNHLSINRHGSCDTASPVKKSMPTPLAYSSSPVIQVILAELQLHNPYPAFRFSCWRAAWALCKWDQLWGFDCRSRGGRQREFKGHRAGGKLDQLPEKKMHWASLQQCFAAVKWSVLYFSEWRLQRVCRSRLKCTQVRW